MNSQIGNTLIALFCLLIVCMSQGLAEAALKCYDCHGTRNDLDIRPNDNPFRNPSSGGFQGNHRTHLGDNATPTACSKCHPGSTSYTSFHRDGKILLSSKINNSPETTFYNNRTTAWLQTSSPAPGNCSSVNCHFEHLSPGWGSAPDMTSCSTCHSTPPIDGSHAKKHGDYFGNDTSSCSKCHPNHLNDDNTFAHATSAGKRSLSIQFITTPNSGGSYNGNVSYPDYLPSQNPARNGSCTNLYCHSDGRGGPSNLTPLTWSDNETTVCYSCHKGRTLDSTFENCTSILGNWSSAKGYCTPDLTMSSNAHHRLTGPQWVRKYPCTYCHNATIEAVTDGNGKVTDGGLIKADHVNGSKNIKIAAKWEIGNRPLPSYDPATKVCNNVYCHSDGTSDPEDIRPVAWTAPKTECNACHGHPTGSCSNTGCHDGKVHVGDPTGKLWTLPAIYGNASSYHWPAGQEWIGSLPMFPNQGAGTQRANSHPRHAETNFTCDQCHAKTVLNGACTTCHVTGIPPGGMSEVAHINAAVHVDRNKDVDFKDDVGEYDILTKKCTNTTCHPSTEAPPVWGGSVNSSVTCLSCHGTPGADIDDYNAFNGTQGRINLTQWETTGHGRYSSAAYTGSYPKSGNPAASFPGNPCWYCHDNSVLHKDSSNPYRLKMHVQYDRRFEKECVYCHMVGTNVECLACHVGQTESLSPQATTSGVLFKFKNGSSEIRYPTHTAVDNCVNGGCHDTDSNTHNANAGTWTPAQKDDVKNQYMMMGVCLQCHDDDSSNQCTSCHVAPPENPLKYSLGYDPGTGFIKPRMSRASAGHFGYKHYRAFMKTGGWTITAYGNYSGNWKGGKFCWDCHDPHGDSNIYMVQKKVATETDGRFGAPIPGKQATVVFTDKQSGANYVKKTAPFDGICNVCHSSDSKHFTSVSGDSHNYGRVCTTCHEHRFADSHANKQSCDSCHESTKPIPKHTAFGLPRDCTKCHTGTVGLRMDVMGQMKSNSHHVQSPEVTNIHCYACHWEATPEGLIDVRYHTGYNYINYSTLKNDVSDLVIWGPNIRPTVYREFSSAAGRATVTKFLATKIGTVNERSESAKINTHCISCHSDQNNDSDPFGDCKTPRTYAWDHQSIDARYSNKGTTLYGKYNSSTYTNANKKDTQTKAFSAHGNAVANQGGFSPATGYDAAITNTRNGAYDVTCFDCHSSHGSKAVGITSSYFTFNGSRNGGNLKETQAGKGGYAMTYKAVAKPDGVSVVNPYNTGAAQCFDCHLNQNSGVTPWGYQSTFGATDPIMAYRDSMRFGQDTPKPFVTRYPFRDSRKTIVSSHLKAKLLNYTTSSQDRIDGLCTPCHDPHGISPTLGANQAYAVPLLRGTWMTSPYKDENPLPTLGRGIYAQPQWRIDRNTLSTDIYNNSNRIRENDSQFAGLCIRCHQKSRLTDGTNKNGAFKSLDRVHESVQGWGANDEHSFPCSKCHQPHNSGLSRLMQTNCLDVKHRGTVPSGGSSDHSNGFRGGGWVGYPRGGNSALRCHGDANDLSPAHIHWNGYPGDVLWNNVTPWP